ncbi:hypothetical protein WJX81_000486 [Elliptochloris bilobata]|uniref:RNA helicase n=1 Tax=Elliptochloris bilobata TaxID=381761 RepID=A0AAW1SHK0_9CHLO
MEQQAWVDRTGGAAEAVSHAGEDADAPPGFEHVAPGTHDVASLAANLSSIQVGEGEDARADNEDPALGNAGLQEPEDNEIRTVHAGDTPYTSAASFDDLPISEMLLQGLYTEMKFEKPSRIQAKTLPMILTKPYRSLIAQAHNGSGKTTCFVLAMVSRVDPKLAQPQALCVCPTRELVMQNLQVLERLARHAGITATSTAAVDFQITRQTRIVDHVVFGTHGSLKNWMSKRVLSVNSIKILVFDEADEMLKVDAFASDSVRMIKDVRQATGNPDLQILLFSATFNDKVKNFAMKVVPGANQVFVPREDLSLDVIKQYKVVCPTPQDKLVVLKDMIFPQCEKLGQTIIFVRTRETARALHSAMERDGHRCTSIEGSMMKDARDRVVQEFREGTTKVLISTDVLSRGFDVTQVTLVVNFDVPTERNNRDPAFETYLHRIGRSGRFGRKGAAFNLVCGFTETAVIDQIADYFHHPIPEVPYNDEERFIAVLKEAGLTEG